MGKAELGPSAHQFVWQRLQPPQERGELATGYHCAGALFDQPGCPLEILCRQGVLNGRAHLPLGLKPNAGPEIQLRYHFRLRDTQTMLQEIGKQVVVAIPASLIIQGNNK